MFYAERRMDINPPEKPYPLRKLSKHEAALAAIVRPDHVEAIDSIFSLMEKGTITLSEGRIKTQEVLIRTASEDRLTGLPNARAGDFTLTNLIEYSRRQDISLTGLYFDANNFRQINAVLGHTLGDQAIIALGKALEEATRPTDLQVRVSDEEHPTPARLGGDEFFVALPGATLEEAQTVFQRISDKLAVISDQLVPDYRKRFGESMTITGGAAQFRPDIDRDSVSFVHRCERAMQEGKETKKGSLTISNPPQLQTISSGNIPLLKS